LYQAASALGDEAALRRITANLERAFPEHLTTKTLQALERRRAAVGKSFPLNGQLADGKPFDISDWRGAPVLVVVWAGFSENGRRCASAIEMYRSTHPAFRVIGVNLDSSQTRMEAACKELGLDWPQLHDGLGWAGEFARTWSVREIPLVVAIDRAGRLIGWGGMVDWRDLATQLAKN